MSWKPVLVVFIIGFSYIQGSVANTLPHDEIDNKALDTKEALGTGEAPLLADDEALAKEGLPDATADEGHGSEKAEQLDNKEEVSYSSAEDLYTSQNQAETYSRLDSGDTKSSKSTFVSDGTVHITKAPDCMSLYEAGLRKSGIYQLHIEDPGSRRPLTPQVYCELSDSDIDGGGWTYIQSRVDDSVDFYRYWDEYEDGFGDPTGNFWLGLKAMNEMSSPQGSTELMVHFETFIGSTRYAHYNQFFVGDASTNYRLYASEFSGNGGDGLATHNQMMFTTRNRDNDNSSSNCANNSKKRGDWWFNNCSVANLNGIYYPETYTGSNDGIHWRRYRETDRPPVFRHVAMKIRRKKA